MLATVSLVFGWAHYWTIFFLLCGLAFEFVSILLMGSPSQMRL